MITDKTFENNLILLGENAEENDTLIKDAKQKHLWFHLANLSSCHVILQCDKKNPVNKQMIRYCAELCKQHTKYKNLKVTVNYCEIKQVRRTKIKGQVTLNGKINNITV